MRNLPNQIDITVSYPIDDKIELCTIQIYISGDFGYLAYRDNRNYSDKISEIPSEILFELSDNVKLQIIRQILSKIDNKKSPNELVLLVASLDSDSEKLAILSQYPIFSENDIARIVASFEEDNNKKEFIDSHEHEYTDYNIDLLKMSLKDDEYKKQRIREQSNEIISCIRKGKIPELQMIEKLNKYLCLLNDFYPELFSEFEGYYQFLACWPILLMEEVFRPYEKAMILFNQGQYKKIEQKADYITQQKDKGAILGILQEWMPEEEFQQLCQMCPQANEIGQIGASAPTEAVDAAGVRLEEDMNRIEEPTKPGGEVENG